MKKILLMLTMVLVLGFSAICSASNGKVLDAEEAMVNKFLAASNYSAVTSMMTDGMKKDFTEEVFKNFKEQMDKNFGAVSEKRLGCSVRNVTKHRLKALDKLRGLL